MDRWRALVNTVMNIWVHNERGIFLTRWVTISFSRRRLLCGVSFGLTTSKHPFDLSSGGFSWFVSENYVQFVLLDSISIDGRKVGVIFFSNFCYYNVLFLPTRIAKWGRIWCITWSVSLSRFLSGVFLEIFEPRPCMHFLFTFIWSQLQYFSSYTLRSSSHEVCHP
jgi:hypothetical protein